MASEAVNHRLKVCLLSSHPFLMKELQSLLAQHEIDFVSSRLDEVVKLNAASEDVEIPLSNVYVLDLQRDQNVTERVLNRIIEIYPDSKAIVLAESFSEEIAFNLLERGVKGLLDYSTIMEQLPRALGAVQNGGYWVPRDVLSRFVDSILPQNRKSNGKSRSNDASPRGGEPLTPREHQILAALLENRSNKEIANMMNISERTVKFHVSNVLQKFKVQRRADLILLNFQAQNLSSFAGQIH